MFVVNKEKNEVYSLPAKEIKFSSLKNLGTELILMKGAEHFWFGEFPKLLTDINKVLGD